MAVKIFQNGRGVHAALPQFFFDKREMIAYKCQVEHKNPE